MIRPKIFYLVLILFCHTASFSQVQIQTLIVRAGEDPFVVLPFGYRYLNKEYKDGRLGFQMGLQSNPYKFNLDLLTGKLTFINERKDTMAVQEDVTVKYWYVGKDAYYHDPLEGYFKILAIDTLGKLASHVELIHYVPTNIGYGTTKIRTTSIETAGVGKEQTFERTLRYVLIDNHGTISHLDKKELLMMFNPYEDKIKAFMKKNKTSFKKEEDLVKLFEYCHSLGSLKE